MRTVDLNCDMGEGCPNDAELMKYISSANVACGYHAGDEKTMRRTVELALENNVAVGAHPGYNDRENFGRISMSLSPGEVSDLVTEQITSLKMICDDVGAELHHIKPHGALYNQAAKDRELAAVIAKAVAEIDGSLLVYGLSGSFLISEAEAINLRTASEVFADRTYQQDGSLTPRTEQDALIDDTDESVAQVLQMIKMGTVTTPHGATVPLVAETLCIHGDGEHAVQFAKSVREALTAAGVRISRPF